MADVKIEGENVFSHISRGAFVTILGKFVGIPLGIGSTILITRLFGPKIFGSLRFGLTVMDFAMIFCVLGMSSGVKRYISIAETKADQVEYYVASLVIGCGLSLLVGCSLAYFSKPITLLFFDNISGSVFVFYLGLSLPFATVFSISLAATLAWNYSSFKTVLQDILFKLFQIVLFGAVAYLGLSQASLARSMLLVYVSVCSLAVLSVGFILRDDFDTARGLFHRIRFDSEKIRPLVTFSLPLLFTKSVWYLMNNADTLMIGYFIDESAVGLYSGAFSLALFVRIVFNASGSLFMPNMARLYEKDRISEICYVYRKVTKWLVILSLPIMIGNVGFPKLLLAVFGKEFGTMSITLVVLSVGIFSNVIFGLNGTIMPAINRPRILLYNNLVVLLLNLALNTLLIPRYGIIGGAVATTISYFLLDLLHGFVLYRELGLVPIRGDFVVTTVCSLALIVGIGRFGDLGITTLTGAIVYGAITYSLYLGVILKLDYISIDEFFSLLDF
ncbi:MULTISPECIES: flippase [unclassified Haladaptatus]|uniref:flippase n=1 Tax=unclassified Haladaptatus TaxID=2622732 RepID=UPI00209C08AD|nr:MULTISPECIES: flippase [unclassified Haladaptatus]MCO8244775.1 flippase [Haladaptatus sp. AB643]MCO8255713.1 flippase [Haladaptatus sp. AB618]